MHSPLEGIILKYGGIFRHVDDPESKVRTEGVRVHRGIGVGRSRRYDLMDVSLSLQMSAPISHVTSRNRHTFCELALDDGAGFGLRPASTSFLLAPTA